MDRAIQYQLLNSYQWQTQNRIQWVKKQTQVCLLCLFGSWEGKGRLSFTLVLTFLASTEVFTILCRLEEKTVTSLCIHTVAQLCLTLCDPIDCSLPGSSLHGIFQARILEWVAISYSRGSCYPGTEPASLVSPALAGGCLNTGKYWITLNHDFRHSLYIFIS